MLIDKEQEGISKFVLRADNPTELLLKVAANFEQTVDAITDYGLCILSPETKIVSWNKGAEKITGWLRRDAINMQISSMFVKSAVKNDKLSQLIKAANQKNSHQLEVVMNTKENSTFLAEISLSHILTDSDAPRPIGYTMIMRDITKPRQQATEQIDANVLLLEEIERRKKVEDALHHSNEELDAFASAASHDLQEPLRMVVSYLQLLERRYTDVFDKDGKEFLAFAVDGATRMKVLISDLVEYSRIDMLGKPLLKTNSARSLDLAIENLKVSIKESGAKITHDKLPVVWSDPIQLTQLFQNLLANAIKFRRNVPPRIHVSANINEDEIEFQVRDNGQGIEAKNLEHVFVIFKQLNKRVNRSGSGLGLAITKKIISRHGGRIWVESDVGKGSTFFFTIPNKPVEDV